MGSKILYHLLILPVSKLPFTVLYWLSDLCYLVLYKLIKYRTKVVYANIRNSFPEKSEKEIKRIESEFYKHLCDVIVEALKAFSISKEQAQKRMVHKNPDLANQYLRQGRDVVMAGGHYGNWELFAVTIGMQLEGKSIALFTPLKDKYMNEKVLRSRSKYGLSMLSIQSIKKELNQLDSGAHTIIFGADQSPRKSQKSYWMEFLNQETGVQFGTEKFAKEFKAAVIFGHIHRIKRGYYEVEYQLICEDATEVPHGYITQKHTSLLEKEIIKKPEHWLWSHKRWKHKRPDGEPLNQRIQF